jgi:transcriptional regulator with XRE-family HTH domain
MTLGERIRQEREARNWTQADLARRVGGVTSQYISMLEKG